MFLNGCFEEFAARMGRFTRVHCGQRSLNLKWFHSWLYEHQEQECYLWDSNFYPFLSTAGLVLAGAATPAEHGSSHGVASFSGYLPPHVDPQHHSSPDIHTHHHNTPSTSFTPAGSWGSDLYLQDEPELELSVGEVMMPDSQSLSWTFVFKQCLWSVLLQGYLIPKRNFSSKDSICLNDKNFSLTIDGYGC